MKRRIIKAVASNPIIVLFSTGVMDNELEDLSSSDVGRCAVPFE
jgi:hypothetical protein